MEPSTVSVLTVEQLLSGINQISPLINGIWAVLSIILAATIAGAIWVTRISIAVKHNTEAIESGVDNINPNICQTHRDACNRTHALEYATISQSLADIKVTVDKMYERYDRQQDNLIHGRRHTDSL